MLISSFAISAAVVLAAVGGKTEPLARDPFPARRRARVELRIATYRRLLVIGNEETLAGRRRVLGVAAVGGLHDSGLEERSAGRREHVDVVVNVATTGGTVV
jgi:hypothetical protein